jgi:hypothetical protein
MSNVISIGLPKRPNLSQRQSALLDCFARHRRSANDVFWLKENAEALNVMASTGAALPPKGLDAYRAFYDGIEERMQFFPQYFRFLLSICLDLEDLGLEGNKGQILCDWVRRARLVEAELSDLQRAEAGRLVARRGGGAPETDLTERLIRFICHAETFALPNKKAAYELTHIVFYLSDYGAQPLDLPVRAVTSLEYAGLLAFLDQDVDLLSEVCVALRFAGRSPSDIWEDWLERELAGFVLVRASGAPAADAYHEYLVTSWWAIHAGRAAFPGSPQTGAMEVRRYNAERGPLRAMSELMYQLGSARSGDWNQMRGLIERALPPEHHSILNGAAESSPLFETFFEGFARA